MGSTLHAENGRRPACRLAFALQSCGEQLLRSRSRARQDQTLPEIIHILVWLVLSPSSNQPELLASSESGSLASRGSSPCFGFFQYPDNLPFGKSLLFHRPFLCESGLYSVTGLKSGNSLG